MANKQLFTSSVGKLVPATDVINHEQAPAYAFSPQHRLAQYAATGCLNATFYASDKEQLDQIVALCHVVEPEFIAKTALYCREKGFMKDLPALLCAALSVRDFPLLHAIFHRVIDSGKMLRNFVQIMRSGVIARKSLGSGPKRLVQSWFAQQRDEEVFCAAVGQDPSLADVIKMVHPKPRTSQQEALYGYLLDRPHDGALLPSLVREYEAFKKGETREVPEVPFLKLTALDLSEEAWAAIAKRASWQTIRMNLNTFARHGVFTRPHVVKKMAARLRDREAIRKAKAFPYQLLVAYTMAERTLPSEIRAALQYAMEKAIRNVPSITGQVYVCPDVSGSMSAPVTGYRKGATSAVRCIDVAALVAAAVVRKNPAAQVLPFANDVVSVEVNPRDSVMTNAVKLAAIGGGGTNCSAPLAWLNRRKARGDFVIFISDNESWVDARRTRGTATMQEWERFRVRNPSAKLVCIDIQPYGATQAAERTDILNVGGFSDAVFDVIARFHSASLSAEHWVGEIAAMSLT